MSLVSYLKALCSRFYSKNESELVGHQDMPSESYIDYYSGDIIGNWQEVTSFVAPSDGYARIGGLSNSETLNACLVPSSNSLTTYIAYTKKGLNFCTFLPIRKGDLFRLEGYEVNGVVVSFVKTIGGGINRLFRCFGGACYA